MKQVAMLALAAGLMVMMVPDQADAQGRNQGRARVEQRERGNGPAFCRSGEGHPVFGRQWCRDKGFGLGNDRYDRRDRRDRRDRDDRYDRRDRDGRYDPRYPGRIGDDTRQDRRPGRIGDRYDERNIRWRTADFGNVEFRLSGGLSGRDLNRSELQSVLGSRAIARLTRHAYESGATGDLNGIWTDTNPLVLRVYAGRVPIAEFIDRNRDRRVDRVNLAYWN